MAALEVPAAKAAETEAAAPAVAAAEVVATEAPEAKEGVGR